MTPDVPTAAPEAQPTPQPAIPAEQPPSRVDYAQLERQAAFVAHNEADAAEAWLTAFEKHGGKYFADLNKRMSELERDAARSKAIVRYGLTEADGELIDGATPEEIYKRAEKLAARLPKSEPKVERGTPAKPKTAPKPAEKPSESLLPQYPPAASDPAARAKLQALEVYSDIKPF